MIWRRLVFVVAAILTTATATAHAAPGVPCEELRASRLTGVTQLDANFVECSQLGTDYDPHPPFNAGSLKTASAPVREQMKKLLAGFTADAEKLAASGGNRKPG